MTVARSPTPPGEPVSSPQPGRGAVRDCGGGPRCEVCRTRRAETVCAECHMLLCGEHDALLRPRIVLDLHEFLRRRRSSAGRSSMDVASPAEATTPSAADRDAGPARRATLARTRTAQSAFAGRRTDATPNEGGQ